MTLDLVLFLKTGMSHISKNSNNMQSQPFIHVPKVDKSTGQPIPAWKQQLMMTRIAKKLEQEQMVQNQVGLFLSIVD